MKKITLKIEVAFYRHDEDIPSDVFTEKWNFPTHDAPRPYKPEDWHRWEVDIRYVYKMLIKQIFGNFRLKLITGEIKMNMKQKKEPRRFGHVDPVDEHHPRWQEKTRRFPPALGGLIQTQGHEQIAKLVQQLREHGELI